MLVSCEHRDGGGHTNRAAQFSAHGEEGAPADPKLRVPTRCPATKLRETYIFLSVGPRARRVGWSRPAAGWSMASTTGGIARTASMVRVPAHASTHTHTPTHTHAHARASALAHTPKPRPSSSSSPQGHIVHRTPPSSSTALHSRHRTHTDRRWKSPSCRKACSTVRRLRARRCRGC